MRSNEELAMAIQAGEKEAISLLYLQCKGFICQQALRWGKAWQDRPSFDTDDLIQAGYMALYDAVEHYEPERGGFLNFLLFYLKTEFSNVVGCRTEAQKQEPLNTYISLETPISADAEGELTIADTISAEEEGFQRVEESEYTRQLSQAIREALETIPERQRLAIAGHYLQGRTYEDIGLEMDVCGARAGQLINDGLRSLRRCPYRNILQEFVSHEVDFYQYTGLNAWRASGCSVQERALIFKKIAM